MPHNLPFGDYLMGRKGAHQASGDKRHRPISAGQVAANQGFSFPWSVIRQRVDVTFPNLVLVREPHLVTPHERGIQQEWIMGREKDLRTAGILLRAEHQSQQLPNHERVHRRLQFIDTHHAALGDDVEPRPRNGEESVRPRRLGFPGQGHLGRSSPAVG